MLFKVLYSKGNIYPKEEILIDNIELLEKFMEDESKTVFNVKSVLGCHCKICGSLTQSPTLLKGQGLCRECTIEIVERMANVAYKHKDISGVKEVIADAYPRPMGVKNG